MKSKESIGNSLKIYPQINMENPDQMDKFLDASDQTKLIQEDINHLN
jgi:hypothetical protein